MSPEDTPARHGPADLPDVAVMRDARNGCREEACFFGSEAEPIFGVTHLPSGKARAAVVICSPIKLEFMQNYRPEVLLARQLCEKGHAVQRFHYRGCGNSHGASEALSVDAMTEDARVAAARLRARSGTRIAAFVGTRVGCLPAARLASRSDCLVLWDPVLDADRYLNDLFRVRQIRQVTGGDRADRRGSGELLGELERGGSVDILGFSLDAPLFRSLRRHPLGDALRVSARPTLLLQFGGKFGLRREYEDLGEELETQLETRVVERDEMWWMTHLNPDISYEAVRITADWIDGQLQ